MDDSDYTTDMFNLGGCSSIPTPRPRVPSVQSPWERVLSEDVDSSPMCRIVQ